MMPLPSLSVCMKSAILSMGSPKNDVCAAPDSPKPARVPSGECPALSLDEGLSLPPPCSSIWSKPRWMAPTLAALTLPYSVVKSPALSPTYWHMARRSFMSSSSNPLSSAILKASCNTPACVSLRLSMRAKSRGPRSLTVARTGWPCWPKTSHKVAGYAMDSGAVSARSVMILAIFSLKIPF